MFTTCKTNYKLKITLSLPMRNYTHFDRFIKNLFQLIFPMLLFIAAIIITYTSSKSYLTAFQVGSIGFVIGCIITLCLRKFIVLSVYELPFSFLFIFYLIFVFFFYIMAQGIPLLVLIPGILAGLYYRRAFVYLNKPSEDYDFCVFQVTFFTAVTIGIMSLITSFLILFKLTELEYLNRVEGLVDFLPKPISAVVLVSCCAIIAYSQFMLTKLTMQFQRH